MQCSKIEALPPGTSQNEIEYNATCSWLRYDEGIHHDTSLHSITNKPSSMKGKPAKKATVILFLSV